MELLLPDTGLLFWMVLSFGIVLFILAKFGFPAIIKMVEERREFIEESLFNARKAQDQLDQIKKTQKEMLDEARKEHAKIIQEAREIREGIISDARVKAIKETEGIMKEARQQINREKEEALHEIRLHMTELTILTAEKVLKRELDNKENQLILINNLLDEVNNHQS